MEDEFGIEKEEADNISLYDNCGIEFFYSCN